MTSPQLGSTHIIRTKTKSLQISIKSPIQHHHHHHQTNNNNDLKQNLKMPLLCIPDVLCKCEMTYNSLLYHPKFSKLCQVYEIYYLDWNCMETLRRSGNDGNDGNDTYSAAANLANEPTTADFSMESFQDDLETAINEVLKLHWQHPSRRDAHFQSPQDDTYYKNRLSILATGSGSYFSLSYALKHQKRIWNMFLCGADTGDCGWAEWLSTKWTLGRIKIGTAKDGSIASSAAREHLLAYLIHTEGVDAQIRSMYFELLGHLRGESVSRFYNDCWLRRESLHKSLKQLQVKTVVFAGGESPIFNASIETYSSISGKYTSLIRVRNVGTLVCEEEPNIVIDNMICVLRGEGYLLDLPEGRE